MCQHPLTRHKQKQEEIRLMRPKKNCNPFFHVSIVDPLVVLLDSLVKVEKVALYRQQTDSS